MVLAVGVGTVLVLIAAEVDLGPFQGSTMGAETLTWDAASRIRAEGWKPAEKDFGASLLYPRLLSPLATGKLGAVRAARHTQLFLCLPLLSLLVVALTWRRAGPWPAVLAGIAAPAAAPVVLAALRPRPMLVAVILALAAPTPYWPDPRGRWPGSWPGASWPWPLACNPSWAGPCSRCSWPGFSSSTRCRIAGGGR